MLVTKRCRIDRKLYLVYKRTILDFGIKDINKSVLIKCFDDLVVIMAGCETARVIDIIFYLVTL